MFEIIAYVIDERYAINYGETCIGFRDHINKMAGYISFLDNNYEDITKGLYNKFTFEYETLFNWQL